ncbi:hypothetical protein G7062_10115 [Erysipelothrix sp. HDW6C]|uniref:mannitol dehydrogenase family protein n=1 Tax=Erysipelothrix sp. HDW6C TaxID=2714930 RepID=UPI00140C1D6F|nr:hypothetical protein [Erysipelothrix sp. HDW6C]QIK70635.1 hypothetical protein G7062_10115 [Erysipelothrix sp. HDW6C]
MRKVLIIGAGQTGRGFIPQYLDSKSLITFVDKDRELVTQLNELGTYTIDYYGEKRASKIISSYKAYSMEAEFDVDDFDCIAISVGESNLPEVVDWIVRHFKDIPLLATFENGTDTGGFLRNLFEVHGITANIIPFAIFCTTNTVSLCDIMSEDITYLPYDARTGTQDIFMPSIPIADFAQFMERKIFTYNGLSAIIAYLGYLKGYTYLHEAANDPTINHKAHQYLDTLNQALAFYFKVPLEEQHEFAMNAFRKFSNTEIADTIERNTRDVIRKLGPTERFIKPLNIMIDRNLHSNVLIETIAAALVYDSDIETDNAVHYLQTTSIDPEIKDEILDVYRRQKIAR